MERNAQLLPPKLPPLMVTCPAQSVLTSFVSSKPMPTVFTCIVTSGIGRLDESSTLSITVLACAELIKTTPNTQAHPKMLKTMVLRRSFFILRPLSLELSPMSMGSILKWTTQLRFAITLRGLLRCNFNIIGWAQFDGRPRNRRQNYVT